MHTSRYHRNPSIALSHRDCDSEISNLEVGLLCKSVSDVRLLYLVIFSESRSLRERVVCLFIGTSTGIKTKNKSSDDSPLRGLVVWRGVDPRIVHCRFGCAARKHTWSPDLPCMGETTMLAPYTDLDQDGTAWWYLSSYYLLFAQHQ